MLVVTLPPHCKCGLQHSPQQIPSSQEPQLDVWMPFQVVDKSYCHIRVALEIIPKQSQLDQNAGTRFLEALRRPSQRERDCGSFTDAVWLRRIELQNGAQTFPQTCIVGRSKISRGVWGH